MSESRPTVDRRSFLRGTGAVVVGAGLSGAGLVTRPVAARPGGEIALTHVIAVGDVTAGSAVVWCRASGPGRMQVVYGADRGRVAAQGARHSRSVPLEAAHDFIGQVRLDGLAPGTRYHYQAVVRERGSRALSRVARSPPRRRPPRPGTCASSARPTPARGWPTGRPSRPSAPWRPSRRRSSSLRRHHLRRQHHADGRAGAERSRVLGQVQGEPGRPPAPGPARRHAGDRELGRPRGGQRLPGAGAAHARRPGGVPRLRAPLGGPRGIYRSLRWGGALDVFVLDGRQYGDPLEEADRPGKSMLGD